tara:strand:+ start:442 stop:816 length:375 start_codon:yes stop_codon:yes gene_type:complete
VTYLFSGTIGLFVDKFSPGEIVKVRVKGLIYSPDGFANGSPSGEDGLLVFEEIDQFSFPSFRDFFGKSSLVRDGDLVTIIKYVGRPHQISRDTSWFKYDIYEILVDGQIRQIFSQNISSVKDSF